MKKHVVLVLSVALVLMLALTACGGLKDVGQLGDKFMKALSTGDHATSFSMLSPDIQTEVGGEAGWADWASIRNFDDWKFNSNTIENNEATLLGTATLQGEEYDVTLVFDNNNDQWEIITIIFE